MAEDGSSGGYNVGGGYVSVDVDLSPARQTLEGFKGELQNYFQGAAVIPIGASGAGPVAASGGGLSTPVGGGGGAISFAGLPGIGGGMAPSAFPNIMPGGGGMAGMSGGGDVSDVKSAVSELVGALRQAASEVSSAASVGNSGLGYSTLNSPNTVFAGESLLRVGNPNLATQTVGGGFARHQRMSFVGGSMEPAGAMGLEAPVEDFVRPGSLIGSTEGMSDAQLSTFANVLGGGSASEETSGVGGSGSGVGRGGGFGPFGAISRVTGIPYAGVIAAAYGVHVASSFAHAYEASAYTGSHPELTQNQLAQAGSGLGLMSDPGIQSISSQYDQLSQRLAIRGAVNTIPGMSLFDVGGDSSYAMTQQQGRLGEQAAGIGFFAGVNRQTAGLQAGLSGDEASIYLQGQSAQLRGAEEQAALMGQRASGARDALAPQASVSRLFSAGGYTAAQNYEMDASENSESRSTYRRLASEAADAANALSSLKEATNATASRIRVQQGNAIDVSFADTAANEIMAGGGNAIDAMQVRHAAASVGAAREFNAIPTMMGANFNIMGFTQGVANMTNLASKQDAELRPLQTAYNYQVFQEQIAFENQHQSLLQGANVSAYNASIARTVQGGENQATISRAMGDSYAAGMAGIGARRNAVAAINGAPAQALALSGIQADENALNIEHNFHLQVSDEMYGARQAAAHAAGNYQPMTAQADLAVARGRAEVAHTDNPTERAKAMVTVAAELDTQGKLLTSQRGGETAIDVQGNVAVGMIAAQGLDLTGRGADIKSAADVYKRGAGNLDSSPQRTPVSAAELGKWLDPMLEWIGKYSPAAVSFLKGH